MTLLTLAISILALLATFYQLYLQRVHNEKSLKPLGQLDLYDSDKQLDGLKAHWREKSAKTAITRSI